MVERMTQRIRGMYNRVRSPDREKRVVERHVIRHIHTSVLNDLSLVCTKVNMLIHIVFGDQTQLPDGVAPKAVLIDLLINRIGSESLSLPFERLVLKMLLDLLDQVGGVRNIMRYNHAVATVHGSNSVAERSIFRYLHSMRDESLVRAEILDDRIRFGVRKNSQVQVTYTVATIPCTQRNLIVSTVVIPVFHPIIRRIFLTDNDCIIGIHGIVNDQVQMVNRVISANCLVFIGIVTILRQPLRAPFIGLPYTTVRGIEKMPSVSTQNIEAEYTVACARYRNGIIIHPGFGIGLSIIHKRTLVAQMDGTGLYSMRVTLQLERVDMHGVNTY